MTHFLSLSLSRRAEFRSLRDRFSRRRKPTLRQRVVGRTLAGRAVRLAAVGGAGLGGAALLRGRGKGSGGAPSFPKYPDIPQPKPRTQKQLANTSKVARRKAHIGKAARAGTQGRTSAERRIISTRVKRGAAAARSRLGASYSLHRQLAQFS